MGGRIDIFQTGNVEVGLGDTSGVDEFIVKDSSAGIRFNVDSLGNGLFFGTLQAAGNGNDASIYLDGTGAYSDPIDRQATVAVLESGVIDLTGTTFVDVTIPAGLSFYIKDILVLGVTNVDSNSRIDVGILGDTTKFYSSLSLTASAFNGATDAEHFTGPSSHQAVAPAAVIRITPNGGATASGSVIVKLLGLYN